MKVPKRIRVGSHEVEEEVLLSEGGYGYIWKVRDTRSGQNYAMKKMICMDREKLQVAKNEIGVLQVLNGHPNVVGFIDSEVVDQGNGTYHVLVLLELCEGGTLVDLLGKYEHNHLKETQIIQIMKQICSALKKMHTQSPPIAHRDIKIENILLNQRQFKICDFGSCSRKHVDLRQIPKHEYAALEEEYDKNTTLMYRPPEMCDLYQQHVVSEKVDIWMLGCALYVICFYKHPFAEASKLAITNAAFQIPENQEYSEKMKDFIRLMLTPNPSLRPDIHQVIKILDNYENMSGIELNKQALDLKAHQKKQAASDTTSFKSYKGDIPMDELMKIAQGIKKDDDDDYSFAPKKKNAYGVTSSNKPSNTSNRPAASQQQQNFAPQSMDFGAWGVTAAPKPQQPTTSNNDFWGNFDAPSKPAPAPASANDLLGGWGGGGDFGWDTPAPAPIKTAPGPAPVQKAVSNTFDNMWSSPGNDTSKSTPTGHSNNDNLWGNTQVWSSNTGSQVPVHKPQSQPQPQATVDNLLDLAAPPPKLDSKAILSQMGDIKF